MSRLTVRDEFGNADVIGANGAGWLCYLECNELIKITEALNKLADYEDAEEKAQKLAVAERDISIQGERAHADGTLELDELRWLEGDPIWCVGKASFWALCWHGKLLTPAGERISAKELMKNGTVFYGRKVY